MYAMSMKKKKVYIETSVLSYYTGRRSRDLVLAGRQQVTQDFWLLLGEDLSPYVSALVIRESSQGDADLVRQRLDAIGTFPVLATTPEAEQLAQEIVNARGVPAEYPEDALHIAIAALGGVEFVVTWNFAHINNPFTKMMIRQAVENAGYECPEIVSPDAFLGAET